MENGRSDRYLFRRRIEIIQLLFRYLQLYFKIFKFFFIWIRLFKSLMNLGKTYSKDDRSNKSPTFLNIQRLLVRWLPSQPSKVLRDRDTIEAFFHATNWQEPWTKSESICAWNRDEEWKTSILGHLGWIAMSKEGGARASGCFSRGNILSLSPHRT